MININILQAKKYYHLNRIIIEQSKFTYSPLNKAFEKQIKTIGDWGIKQAEALKNLKLEENRELEATEGLFSRKDKK